MANEGPIAYYKVLVVRQEDGTFNVSIRGKVDGVIVTDDHAATASAEDVVYQIAQAQARTGICPGG